MCLRKCNVAILFSCLARGRSDDVDFLLEGDIAITAAEAQSILSGTRKKRAVMHNINFKKRIWPKGELYYTIDRNMGTFERTFLHLFNLNPWHFQQFGWLNETAISLRRHSVPG